MERRKGIFKEGRKYFKEGKEILQGRNGNISRKERNYFKEGKEIFQ